jgi:hypothetical protein
MLRRVGLEAARVLSLNFSVKAASAIEVTLNIKINFDDCEKSDLPSY